MVEFIFIFILAGLITGFILGSIIWRLKIFLCGKAVDLRRLNRNNKIAFGVLTCIIIVYIVLYSDFLCNIQFYLNIIVTSITVICSIVFVFLLLMMANKEAYKKYVHNDEYQYAIALPLYDAYFCVVFVWIISSVIFISLFHVCYMRGCPPYDWATWLRIGIPEYITISTSTFMAGVTAVRYSVKHYRKFIRSKAETLDTISPE